MEEEKKERNFWKEGVVGTIVIFGAVVVFGALADKFLNSEEKAKEARRKGYDV